MTNEQAAALARMHDDLVAADARFAKLEVVASTAAGQRDAEKQRADQAVALLREAYGHTIAAHDNLPERIKAALAKEEAGPVDK